jgi:hypothetical protein
MQIEQSFSKTYKSRDHPLVSVVLLLTAAAAVVEGYANVNGEKMSDIFP